MTPARVLELKAEAKRMKLERGIKQSVALDIVAQAEGFRNWVDLVGDAGGAEAVTEAKRDAPPTAARVRRNERYAEHMRRAHT